LRTLRTVTVPETDDIDFEVTANEGGTVFVETALRTHATEYLARTPAIHALSMAHDVAPSGHVYVGDVQVRPQYYGRGRLIDAYGRETSMALPMPKDRLHDIQPVSEIFDIDPSGWRFLRLGYKP